MGITLDKAIEIYEKGAKLTWNGKPTVEAEECQQMAEWLEELKQLREQTKWIPLDEKEPKDGQLVLVALVNIYKKRYVRIAEFIEENYRKHDGKIYQRYYGFHSVDNIYEWGDEAVAWMPLPEPYKAEGSEE